jgi:hypothetical protein
VAHWLNAETFGPEKSMGPSHATTVDRSQRDAVQGGLRRMKWVLFVFAFAGALAVGFFGVLGLV